MNQRDQQGNFWCLPFPEPQFDIPWSIMEWIINQRKTIRSISTHSWLSWATHFESLWVILEFSICTLQFAARVVCYNRGNVLYPYAYP